MFKKKYFTNFYKLMVYKIFKILYGEINSVSNTNKEPGIDKKEVSIEKVNTKFFFFVKTQFYTQTEYTTQP